MMRAAITAFAIAVAGTIAFAQDAPVPEDCLAKAGETSALPVTHDGKTYRLANEACRAQFVGDPERYAQLYDAMLELEAEGTPLRAAPPSLVPS